MARSLTPAMIVCVSRLDPDECRRRFAAAPRAVLATIGTDGAPDLVPVTFGLHGDVLVTAVDHKPKRTGRLQRLANLRRDPRAALIADRWDDDDWDRLWWVRAEGRAQVLDAPPRTGEVAAALDVLAGRYAQYRDRPPSGPVIAVAVDRWTGWAPTD